MKYIVECYIVCRERVTVDASDEVEAIDKVLEDEYELTLDSDFVEYLENCPDYRWNVEEMR